MSTAWIGAWTAPILHSEDMNHGKPRTRSLHPDRSPVRLRQAHGGRPMTPDWTRYVRVDAVIECYAIADATSKALLEAMPDAYGGEAPGEDAWPEPDAKRDEPYKLAKIWEQLSPEVQADIAQAQQEIRGRFGRLV